MAPLTRLAAGLAARWGALPVPLRAWATSRALVFALAIAVSLTIGVTPRGPDPGVADQFVLERPRQIDPAVPAALVVLGDWDVTWYLDIARHGYALDAGQVGLVDSNLAFFPLVPGVMATLLGLGINPFLGMLLLANLALLAALWGLHALTLRRSGSAALAARTTWAFALLPPVAYASMAYTEGLVLACALGAALLACRGQIAAAGALAAVAALSRPPGIIVAGLVLLIVLSDGRGRRLMRSALALGPSLVALGAFAAWMGLARGSPTLPLAAQGAWDRGQVGLGLFTALPAEWAAAFGEVVNWRPDAGWTSAPRDIAFTALYLVLFVALWRREGGWRSPWVGYSAAALAIPLSTGSFASMARFGTLAFPLMWPLAEWLDAGPPARRRWAAAVAVAVTALLIAQLRMRAP